METQIQQAPATSSRERQPTMQGLNHTAVECIIERPTDDNSSPICLSINNSLGERQRVKIKYISCDEDNNPIEHDHDTSSRGLAPSPSPGHGLGLGLGHGQSHIHSHSINEKHSHGRNHSQNVRAIQQLWWEEDEESGYQIQVRSVVSLQESQSKGIWEISNNMEYGIPICKYTKYEFAVVRRA